MGLLKILFSAFIILFPIGAIGRLQFPNGVAITVNDVLLGFVIAVWIFLKTLRKQKISKSYLKKPILIFLSIAFLSLLINLPNLNAEKFLVSFLYLIRFASYVLIYFILKEFDGSFKKTISYLLLFTGSLTVLLGYIQYFFYPNLKNLFYLGWDEHLYRMFSTFLDPNFAGAFFVVFFIYTLVFVKEYFIKQKTIKFLFLSFISLSTLGAVYLTYSRSAFLMLIASIITFLILSGRKKLILIVIGGLMLIIFLAPKSFTTEGTNYLRITSSSARITSLNEGFKIFQSSPIFGVGFNAYRYAQNKYAGLDNIYWKTTHSGAGTDNSFLFVLATTGIVGLISYLYLLYNILTLSKKNLKKNKYAIVLLSSLIGLITGSLFINSLFYVLIFQWIWILSGLTENS